MSESDGKDQGEDSPNKASDACSSWFLPSGILVCLFRFRLPAFIEAAAPFEYHIAVSSCVESAVRRTRYVFLVRIVLDF